MVKVLTKLFNSIFILYNLILPSVLLFAIFNISYLRDGFLLDLHPNYYILITLGMFILVVFPLIFKIVFNIKKISSE